MKYSWALTGVALRARRHRTVSFSNRDTSWNAWNRHSGSYSRYGDLIQQYEGSLSRILNDILNIDQQWLLNRSDFLPISWPWYRAWPSPKYECFPWSICNGCGMPAGNAYPSVHLVPSPFLGLVCAPIARTCQVFTRFFTLNTPWYFLDFAFGQIRPDGSRAAKNR